MKILKLMLFICFFYISLVSYGQSIHFIMVIQESAPGSAKDKITMRREIETIGRNCGMSIKLYSFNKDDANIAQGVMRAKQAVQQDDVLWFYYSGHGAGNDGYPMFNNYKMTVVHNIISQASCRLKITQYDCCNAGGDAGNRLARSGMARHPNHEYLFKHSKGNIKMCSSSDGRYSYGSPQVGGFFSLSFLDAIENVTPSPDMWSKALIKTREITNQLCVDNGLTAQHPRFEASVVTDVNPTYATPDKIVIGLDNSNFFYSYEDIYFNYKKHPDHVNQKDFTIDNLKKWNNNAAINDGSHIWLVKPYSNSSPFSNLK
jgi:hypothetical protein